MIFIGIDPGLTGAMAIIGENPKELAFYDMPTLEVQVGGKTKNVPNVAAMAQLLRAYENHNAYCVVERVNAMPGRGKNGEVQTIGATSAFNFGMGFGMWLGILAALEMPHGLIAPQTWKKAMMADMGKEKDASRIKAMQLFPQSAESLKLKKHHGRADALLMAEYARRVRGLFVAQ